MKTKKLILFAVLASALFVIKAEIAFGAQYSVSVHNTLIGIKVRNDTVNNFIGTFSVGLNGSDFIFRHASNEPGTSFTTIRIDGIDKRFGDKVAGSFITMPSPSTNAIYTSWRTGDIEVQQLLSIITNPITGSVADTVEVKYTIINQGAQPRQVGLRMMMDLDIGHNDTPFVSTNAGQSVLTQEAQCQGTNIPARYFVYDAFPNYTKCAMVTLSGYSATTPDELIIACLTDVGGNMGILRSMWSYQIGQGRLFDTASAIYWNPLALLSGQSRSYIYYISPCVSQPTPVPTGTVVYYTYTGPYSEKYYLKMIQDDKDSKGQDIKKMTKDKAQSSNEIDKMTDVKVQITNDKWQDAKVVQPQFQISNFKPLISNSELKIYPNPVSRGELCTFVLPNLEEGKKIHLIVYDISGHLIMERESRGTFLVIDSGLFSPGIYICQVKVLSPSGVTNYPLYKFAVLR